jgi:hypothetical protein
MMKEGEAIADGLCEMGAIAMIELFYKEEPGSVI